MELEYFYYKKRSQFGSPCNFYEEGPNNVLHLPPDIKLRRTYIPLSLVNRGIQDRRIMSSHEVNTWRPDYADRGINHDQGGWPENLNVLDEEAVYRYRKKLEREENYITSMKELSKPMEHAVLQNNAVNIYQKYFEDSSILHASLESNILVRNIYRDPTEIKRTVSSITWSPEKDMFAAAYCTFSPWKSTAMESCETYIWDLEVPCNPKLIFDSKIPVVSIEWNWVDRNLLIAGLHSGQIALYDQRRPPEHTDITSKVVAHRDPVHSVIWTISKTGFDFFSTSSDGEVKWWDCRNLSQIVDSVILDLTKSDDMSMASPASYLSYDPNVSAKYLVGTDTGYVICGYRKGANIAEKITWFMRAHWGPILSVERNAFISKCFLTVGDWNVRIWSEECKDSPIIWTRHYNVPITRAEWSKSRYSVFFVTREDGHLDVWDLLHEQKHPIYTLKVCDQPLTTLRLDDQGRLVVVGDTQGRCFLVQYTSSLATCGKNDKTLLANMFDRETHREKVLEGRLKEIRLNLKLKAMAEEPQETSDSNISKDVKDTKDYEDQERLLTFERQYLDEITQTVDVLEDDRTERPENKEAEEEEIKTENEFEIDNESFNVT